MIGITLIRSDTRRSQYFEQGRIVIGSSPESDVQLKGPAVQPTHALIQVTHGIVVIQPADRHCLITVDGIPISGVHTLADSQSFTIDSVKITVQWDEPEAKTKVDFDRNEVLAVVARKKKARDTELLRPAKHEENNPEDDYSENRAKIKVEADKKNESTTLSASSTEQASPVDTTAAMSTYQDPKPAYPGSFPSPDDTAEFDEELLRTHRLAVSELANAFASVHGSPKPGSEELRTTELKKSSLSSIASSDRPPPLLKDSESALGPTSGADLDFDSEGEDFSEADQLALGQASESHTQQLNGVQVASLYKLYKKKKIESQTESERGLAEESADDPDAEEFSLSQILLKGPEAFGVRTWDDVAAEASTLQEVSDDPIEGLAKLHSVDNDDTLRKITLGTLVGLMAVVLALLMMMPNDPIVLGEEDDTIKDIDISKLEPVEHLPRAIRCFSESECVAMATRELEIAKTSWDNRNSDYENRFRAFDHADRARKLLASQDLEMTQVPELEGTWNQTRDELDAIFQSLRVSFFIAISQKRYEDAFETLSLAEVYFPTPRAREKRWAETLKLALKERGIEAQVNHRRAVRGRWN